MHMKRALGTMTPWATFHKATEVKLSGFEEGILHEDSREVSDSSTPGTPTNTKVTNTDVKEAVKPKAQ